MKKLIATLAIAAAATLGLAGTASADGMPSVKGDSISQARKTIKANDGTMTLFRIGRCSDAARVAVEQRNTYFRAGDKWVVNVKFACK